MRIVRACRESGIESVAAYSDADADAPFTRLADYCIRLGPAPAAESYLDVSRVIAAAKESGADAIHPGYGFLSERAELPDACEAAGLTFVGPPAAVMRALGDKVGAKELMIKAGVPTVPGYHGSDQADSTLLAAANGIGYPVLIKAAAGGGGRGMRVVSNSAEFGAQLQEARKEAGRAFGDGRMLLEKYIQRPRHVEVQFAADSHGSVIHLFERECSLQRRHQKVTEESPAVRLDPIVRSEMCSATVRAALAAGYVGVGTAEFLVSEETDGLQEFYFLEVNARLQVEHPVTEMCTGIDIVALQLRIAAGEPLLIAQDDVHSRGHSIEARIYAEDPANEFAPSIGKLHVWRPPAGPGIRVDSGVEQGSEVSPYYDAMLAKVIVHAENRAAAHRRLETALRDFHVLGVRTNIPYLLSISRDPVFAAGDFDTGFLDRRTDLRTESGSVPNEVFVAASVFGACEPSLRKTAAVAQAVRPSPWAAGDSWRNA